MRLCKPERAWHRECDPVKRSTSDPAGPQIEAPSMRSRAWRRVV
jgi:hypothetical protein